MSKKNIQILKNSSKLPFKVKDISINYENFRYSLHDITVANEEYNNSNHTDHTTFKEHDEYLEEELIKLTDICKEYESKRLLKNREITIRKLKLINEETRETLDNYGKMAAEDFLKEKMDDVYSLLKDLQAYSSLLGDVEFTIYTLSPKDVYKILFEFIPQILPFEQYENILIEFLSFEEAFEYAGYDHILDLVKKIPEYKRLSDGELENIVVELTKYVDDAISDYRTRVLQDSILNGTGVPESWWDYDFWWNEVDVILSVKDNKFMQVVSADVQKTVEIRTDPVRTVQPQKIHEHIESIFKDNLDILSIEQKDIPHYATDLTYRIQSSFIDKQLSDLNDSVADENYQDRLLIFDSYFYNRVNNKMLNLLKNKKHSFTEGDAFLLKKILEEKVNWYSSRIEKNDSDSSSGDEKNKLQVEELEKYKETAKRLEKEKEARKDKLSKANQLPEDSPSVKAFLEIIDMYLAGNLSISSVCQNVFKKMEKEGSTSHKTKKALESSFARWWNTPSNQKKYPIILKFIKKKEAFKR